MTGQLKPAKQLYKLESRIQVYKILITKNHLLNQAVDDDSHHEHTMQHFVTVLHQWAPSVITLRTVTSWAAISFKIYLESLADKEWASLLYTEARVKRRSSGDRDSEESFLQHILELMKCINMHICFLKARVRAPYHLPPVLPPQSGSYHHCIVFFYILPQAVDTPHSSEGINWLCQGCFMHHCMWLQGVGEGS